MLRLTNYLLLLILCGVTLTGCGQEQPQLQRGEAQQPYIVAVNNPLYYFASRLIDEEIQVRLPVPDDIDPAQWQPSIEELLQLQGAELLLLNGAGYSPWVASMSIASNRVVITAGEGRERWVELQGEVTHSHGPQGDHAHGGYAFTTWMDMSLAKTQAQAIASAISTRWPEKSAAVSERLRPLIPDIDELDRGYREFATTVGDRQLIYSHPVYQYFERAYGLAGHSLHWEPGEMPSQEQWQELEELLQPDALFIWEAEPIEIIAQRMNDIGLQFIVIDPGANRADRDWLAVQKANLSRLQ